MIKLRKKEIGNKLRELRNVKGYTQQNVSNELGLKYKGTLGNWEIGNSEPDIATFLRLCEIYEINNILDVFGLDNSFDIKANNQEQELLKTYRLLDVHGKKIVDTVLSEEYERIKLSEKVLQFPAEPVYEKFEEATEEINIYDQYVSAGSGSYIDNASFEVMRFPVSQIPRGAKFGIRISGDSMEPTINDKQIVFILPTPQIGHGEIGIFNYDGEFFCKRLELDHEARSMYLVSDNKKYAKKKVIGECWTIGKVLL